MENIVDLSAKRQEREQLKALEKYRIKLLTADKDTLLTELCDFHERIQNVPEDINLLMKGHCLVDSLKSRALTESLYELVEELEFRLDKEVNTEFSKFT